MTSNGILNLSPLDFVELQKKNHNRMFGETLQGRKLRNEGEVSIAAARGILKILNNSNSLGYNSKMKVINDRITMQVMNKYKTGFIHRLSSNSDIGEDKN